MLDFAPAGVDIGARLLSLHVKMVRTVSCSGKVLPVPALGTLVTSGRA